MILPSNGMADGPLSLTALQNLRLYKYSSVDKSPVSYYILRHYWNGFVQLLPLWLAPNLVTLLGFCCILVNVALLVVYVPDLVGPAPSWIYYSFAAGVWMYSTMDNVDGKQARRTGTSSPLGELFDHGIDSLNCTLASLLETAAMGLGTSKTGAFTAMVPCLPMFFSTWETYHTHTLYLGYFNGPTEGLIIACSVMVASGYFGPQIWQAPAQDVFGKLEILEGLKIRDLWVPVILSAFLLAHLPGCVVHVIKARRKADLPVLPVFLEWTPMLVFTGSCVAWLGSPASHLLRDNHLVLFCLTMSLAFGRLTTKIILNHLTRQPFPYWTVMLLPLVGGAFLSNAERFGFQPISAAFEHTYLIAYFVFALAVYGNWAWKVITTICAFLDINCLTIKSKKDQEGARNFREGLQNGDAMIERTEKRH